MFDATVILKCFLRAFLSVLEPNIFRKKADVARRVNDYAGSQPRRSRAEEPIRCHCERLLASKRQHTRQGSEYSVQPAARYFGTGSNGRPTAIVQGYQDVIRTLRVSENETRPDARKRGLGKSRVKTVFGR